MRRIFISALAIVLGVGGHTVSAQTVGGKLINSIYFDGRPFDATNSLLFSQNDLSFGTARTTAMGGAFTSLGADLSSMSINPAGLGMYQSSDIGFTQALSMTSATPKMTGGLNFVGGGNTTTYGLNNLGVALNLYNSSKGLTSATFGFTYNRVANFNQRITLDSRGGSASIVDVFINQLTDMYADGVTNTVIDNANWVNNEDIRLHEWGATMSYLSRLTDFNGTGYEAAISNGALVNSYTDIRTKGGIDEYNFSMGLNFNSKFYLGATLGVTNIFYRELIKFDESYDNNMATDPIGAMWYDQKTRISGSGFNSSIGIVARPVPQLRIGAAIHMPTVYVLDKTYDSEMQVDNLSSQRAGLDDNDIKFNTGARLLAGISYTLGGKAIVAFDYERAWYNGIRTQGVSDRQRSDDRNAIRELYNAANIFRVGVEAAVAPAVAVRAGASYQPDFLKDGDAIYNSPIAKSYYSLSAGFGFTLGRSGYLDLTYLYKNTTYSNFDLYYYNNGATEVLQEGYYNAKVNRHNVVMTLGVRF